MKKPGIFIVLCNKINIDLSNIKTIDTLVVPNIGENIVFNHLRLKVVDKLIDYSNVEDYNFEDSGRGAENIYLFVTAV